MKKMLKFLNAWPIYTIYIVSSARCSQGLTG
jgi:hypothetical protein